MVSIGTISLEERSAPTRLQEELPMTQGTSSPPGDYVEEVELRGHIIDSLILPKVLDEILTHGGSYVLKDINIGQRQNDASHAVIEVHAPSANGLQEILESIHDHG